MLLIQDPIQLLQGGIQGHLVEGVVHRVPDRVLESNLALKNLGLQAAKGGYSDDGTR
jgi:hypothetical protein